MPLLRTQDQPMVSRSEDRFGIGPFIAALNSHGPDKSATVNPAISRSWPFRLGDMVGRRPKAWVSSFVGTGKSSVGVGMILELIRTRAAKQYDEADMHVSPIELCHSTFAFESYLESLCKFSDERARDARESIQRIAAMRIQRTDQDRFRDEVLQAYDNRCAICGFGPREVLEAAHIYAYSLSGINDSINGICLRADIHCLFDRNLIQICPIEKRVLISPKLRGTYYEKYHGEFVSRRKDGSWVNADYLKKRCDAMREVGM